MRKHLFRVGRLTLATTEEGMHQLAVAQWLRTQRVMFLHIPNGARRNVREGLLLKLLGLETGAADILIFDSPPLRKEFKGLALEMKSLKGTLQATQRDWLCRLEEKGWLTAVCKGADAAIRTLIEMGYRKF